MFPSSATSVKPDSTGLDIKIAYWQGDEPFYQPAYAANSFPYEASLW